MGTIVFLTAFLLATSANPLEPLSAEHIEDTTHTDNQEEHNLGTDFAASTNISQSAGEDDPRPNEEHVSSSAESAAPGGNDANKPNEQPYPPSDMPPTSGENDGTNNAGEADPSSVSPLTTISTEPSSSDGDETNGGEHTNTSLNETLSTNSTNASTDAVPTSTSITEPPDADPEDCKPGTPEKHVYLACEFSCSGDTMVVAPNNSMCLLGSPELQYNLTAAEYRRVAAAQGLGICINGACVNNSIVSSAPTVID